MTARDGSFGVPAERRKGAMIRRACQGENNWGPFVFLYAAGERTWYDLQEYSVVDASRKKLGRLT